jgi:hypothetical protein
MGKIVYMAIFTFWFEEHPYKIPTSYGSNVGESWFCQMLHQQYYYP